MITLNVLVVQIFEILKCLLFLSKIVKTQTFFNLFWKIQGKKNLMVVVGVCVKKSKFVHFKFSNKVFHLFTSMVSHIKWIEHWRNHSFNKRYFIYNSPISTTLLPGTIDSTLVTLFLIFPEKKRGMIGPVTFSKVVETGV